MNPVTNECPVGKLLSSILDIFFNITSAYPFFSAFPMVFQLHLSFSSAKVFHEMVNAGVEPNVHTYGALIDGCGRAGEVAKAFGAYGIMRSKVLLE